MSIKEDFLQVPTTLAYQTPPATTHLDFLYQATKYFGLKE
jgi:hypothetical protein